MALDELTLLINHCRELEENNENGNNDDKIDIIRDRIANLLSKSNEKVIIKCSYEKEVCMSDFDSYDYKDWIIDNLVSNHMNQKEILLGDIRNNLDSYVDWCDIIITIEDKNGNKLDSF